MIPTRWSISSAERRRSPSASRRSCCWSTPARKRARARVEPARPGARRAGRHADARRLRGAGRVGVADQPQRDRGHAHARGAARRGAREGRHADRRRHPSDRRRSGRRRTSSRTATARSATRCAGCCGARPRARCTSTSGCRTPRRRSAPATGCAPSCRCCRRSPRTRRTGTASTPASRRRARSCSAATRAPTSRAPSPTGRTTRRRWRRSSRAAGVADYTFLWWDIRPHPKLGTLEVRAMDAQARLGSVCGLAALVHGLVIAAAEAGEDAEEVPREVLVESSFRAGRDGLDATVWHDGALRPIRELAAAAVERARPDARAVGAEAALEEVDRILRDGNGAQRMRAAHAEGGMARVLERLDRRVGRAAGGRSHDVVRPAQRPAPARRPRRSRRRGARSRSPSRRCSTCAPPPTPCWSAATSASTATPPSTRWPASCWLRCRCPCTSWPATTTTPRP